MTRPVLIASLLTVLAFPIPSAAAPAVPAAVPEPAEVEPLPARVANPATAASEGDLMVAQFLGGYLIGIGGTILLAGSGVLPDTGSDTGNLALLGAMASTLTTAAVCGAGYRSRRYQGQCATTFLGALAGMALGVAVGTLVAPAASSSEDLSPNLIASVLCAGLFMPIGAVAGWEMGKREIAQPPMPMAQLSRNLMLPVLSLRW